MREFELIEGEGIAGPFGEVAAITTVMYSCYAFVFENQRTSWAGMYHYPACAIGKTFVQDTIMQMINDIQPQIVHIVPEGTFGTAEVMGKAGGRTDDIHPYLRENPDKLSGIKYLNDPKRLMMVEPTFAFGNDKPNRQALKDYDQVKTFFTKNKPRDSILKIYPASTIGWYRAANGGVDVNNSEQSVNANREGIDKFFNKPNESARIVTRVGKGNIAYYGGKCA